VCCVALDWCYPSEVANSDFSAACSLQALVDTNVTVTCSAGYVGGGVTSCGDDGVFNDLSCDLPCDLVELVSSTQRVSTKEGNFTGFMDNYDYLGSAVTKADVNDDGLVELIVGAYGDDDSADAAGALYVIFLAPDSTVESFQKVSATRGGFTAVLASSNYFGGALDDLGDIDGDGLQEIIAGVYKDDTGGSNAGCVYIMSLTSVGTVHSFLKIDAYTGSGSLTLNIYANLLFGYSVSRGEDINGDGNMDVLVGAAGDDGSGTDKGAVYILFLNSTGYPLSHQRMSAARGWFTGVLVNYDYFGSSVCHLGDLNEDGKMDLAVGAPSTSDGTYRAGAVYIIFLQTFFSFVLSHRKISLTSGSLTAELDYDDQFGTSLSNLGDMNSDGAVDILVGAKYADDLGVSNAGAVFVVFLGTDGECVSHQRLSREYGPFTSALGGSAIVFGHSSAVLGDINGDLIDDWLFGFPNYETYEYTDTGAFLIVFGTGGSSIIACKHVCTLFFVFAHGCISSDVFFCIVLFLMRLPLRVDGRLRFH